MTVNLSVYSTQPRLDQVAYHNGFTGTYMVTSLVTKFDPYGYPYMLMELTDCVASATIVVPTDMKGLGDVSMFSWVYVDARYEAQRGFPHFKCKRLEINQDLLNVDNKISLLPFKYCLNISHLTSLVKLVGAITCDALREAVESVVTHPDVVFSFLTCPASLNYHHNYRGGLLEHTLEVAEYMLDEPTLTSEEKELAIAIAVFHDIGKTQTLTSDLSRTAVGTLVDHSDLNMEICGVALRQLSYQNKNKANQIRHAITCSSENSRYGFAAKTKLAKLLRRADKASANGMTRVNLINSIN